MQKQQLKSFTALPSPQGTPMSLKNEKATAEKLPSQPNSTSSCSSASYNDDSNSVSATHNSATTRRQRSLSAHAKTRSRKADELKAAKSNMVARVQLGLIDMVNNHEVTAREKRMQLDEQAYTFGVNQAQEGSILKPASADMQFRASPDAQQRRSKMQAGLVNETEKSKSTIIYQGQRINSEENARGQQPMVHDREKTRANKVPQTQGTVFKNLSHHQNLICRENSRDALAAGQLAALEGAEPVYDQRQRDQSQPQIKRSKTYQRLGDEQHEQQQNLKASASAFLFDRQAEESKQQVIQSVEQPQPQPTEVAARAQTAAAAVERQIKYLGLVIEKNDEQDLHDDDMQMYYKFRSMREEMQAFKEGKRNLEDGCFIQRQYFPVRERYIRIVKKCRRRVIESFEKRGGRDFRRTRNALLTVVDQQHRLSLKAQRVQRVQASYQ